jgi:hypothetical protein
MLPGHAPQLADARHAGEDRQEHPADGCEQQGHAKRQVPVGAEVRDVHGLAVLRDENQQEQQDDGEKDDGGP